MSIAGIRSNRGDSYQTLIAMKWALTVLSDTRLEWLEVDATTFSVDDVVIGKTDGSLICCQCKKNQPDFNSWSIADLADEVGKASRLLATNLLAEVRFYSRSPFGSIDKLREYAVTQPDEASYRANFSKEHVSTDSALAARLDQAQSISTYEFLRRTTFHVTEDFNQLEEELHERLSRLASHAESAYDAFWRRLSQLGSRVSGSAGSESMTAQHRLTKKDLNTLLHRAGAMLVPGIAQDEIRAAFTGTSSIGRSWHREIAGRRLARKTKDEVLNAIDQHKRSILVTGLPGSGKTCVLLAVQEELELRAQTDRSLVPLFIQSREFAELATAKDRQAQGLNEDWVGWVARLADEAHVVVVIDSLDVLSISREHSALTYFLAQLDQLLIIANVTTLVACRDFDRHYDRRIAGRLWACELECRPLDWDEEVFPLLQASNINVANVDPITRLLIQNPRELALFVELAQREGGFSVVTSQALAQLYLDSIVLADVSLGEPAMTAIEFIAEEMLKTRSITVPPQRFGGLDKIKRSLLSHNVLYEAKDGRLGFGHQTLLDVLVISSAIRKGLSLSDFIKGLSPVPFVRPSIRSFVAQLSTGDRRTFRKQLRAVLMSDAAFHIRRLIAESLAEALPYDEDWPLIRDLRRECPEVFQVIYLHAKAIEWSSFWLKFLVPVLIESKDQEGLMMHLHRSSIWVNQDPVAVLGFWFNLLKFDWLDRTQLASRLGFSVIDVEAKHSQALSPVLEALLRLPRPEHSYLGRSISRCVIAGIMSDAVLWDFVVNDVSEEDVLDLHQLEGKLRCGIHEFADQENDFFLGRMRQSPELLELAVQAVESWSLTRITAIGKWSADSSGFLGRTSYRAKRSQSDVQHIDAEQHLMNAMESAILTHAALNSEWWTGNKERLCFSHEGALKYFGILACSASPLQNLDLIERLLSKECRDDSELLFEIGLLVSLSFFHLDERAQNRVMENVLNMQSGECTEEYEMLRILALKASLLSRIPCYLRSKDAQRIVDFYVDCNGPLIYELRDEYGFGMVRPPFSFQEFVDISDAGVMQLLMHYVGDRGGADNFLIGGEREVAYELREASSRDPYRFLALMVAHWSTISSVFRDSIMEGISNYLAYRNGGLKANDSWSPLKDLNDAELAGEILNEIELHAKYWKQNRAASNALSSCAHVVRMPDKAVKLIGLIANFLDYQEESIISGDGIGLLEVGINMVRGRVTEALMVLINGLLEDKTELPAQLKPLLHQFCELHNPAIYAVILRRLPFLIAKDSDFGWDLLSQCMQGNASGLWRIAEPCLYYNYQNSFSRISPILEHLRLQGEGKDLETWGRISALAALSDRIALNDLLEEMSVLNDAAAWGGAANVWSNGSNIKLYRSACLTGLQAGLATPHECAVAVTQQMSRMFRKDATLIPSDLIREYFISLELESTKGKGRDSYIYGLDEWLSAVVQNDPNEVLTIIELYLDYVRRRKGAIYDSGSNFTQLLTYLFGEAEEKEDTDGGKMLRRVVAVQDDLLALGVTAVNDWLKAAERP